MGRDLQKKKNRSSIARVRHKPKSKKNPALGNALIAAHWDKKQTLSQNYARLGLATRLNGQSGGAEKISGAPSGISTVLAGSLDVKNAGQLAQSDVSEVQIERDPTTGAIVKVLDGSPAVRANSNLKPIEDPLNRVENRNDVVELPLVNQHHISGHVGQVRRSAGRSRSEFMQKLEADAAVPGRKKERKQSQREQEWCQKLFEKHGQDYSAMFKDPKLNIMQQSEGELKRKVMKWLNEGGSMNVVTVND